MNSALKTFILAPVAAVIMAGSFVAAATSAAAQEFPVIKVSHKGIDLTSPEGVRAFDKRIQLAARQACRDAHQNIGVTMRADALCVADLVAVAAADRSRAIGYANSQHRQFASR